MATPIEPIETTTAAEFWQVLSPQKPLFGQSRHLLYRGQADADWNLTPSILRRQISTSSAMQFFKEWAYVDRFVRHCDAVGLPIPNDSPGFRDKYLSQNNLLSPDMRTMDWPPREMQGLLALGQHYGLPTRLLDWSTRSYVAAYFALSDAIRIITQGASSPKSRLAVWILDCEQSNHFKELDVLAVPGGSNANLAAQSGRFTLLKQLGGWATP